MRDFLLAENKLDYSRGKRPDVDCILCAINRQDPQVVDLTVYEEPGFFVTVNLYPFNPGHVMICPRRHVEDIRQFTPDEALKMHHLQVLTLQVLDRVYQPAGYNVGYNLGQGSGASIPHLHLQVVPRYNSELGFFEVFSNTRGLGEHPRQTRERLKEAFGQLHRGREP